MNQSADHLSLDLTLNNPDFSLRVREQIPLRGVTAICGHSGAGKTTLLRCIAGLEKASGDVYFRHECWQQGKQFLPTHRRAIGYVFQEASLFEHLTVDGNLRFAMRRAAQPLSASDYPILLELMAIEPLLQRYPGNLSGGERQRVAMARALLSKPRLLLMDEPLASLDDARKQDILPYLEQLKTLNIPIIYVTHASHEIARLADHIVALQAGQVVLSGTLDQALMHPNFPLNSAQERGVVLRGDITAVDETWQLSTITLSGSSHCIRVRHDGRQTNTAVRLHVLAGDVSITLSHSQDSSIQNILPCTIESISDDPLPGLAMVHLRLGDQSLLARTTRRAVALLQLQPGMAVWAQIKSAALL